jgi:hypothetical protein
MGHPAIGEETDCLSPDVGHRLGHGGSPLRKQKSLPGWAGFFFFYSISSEYQIERINAPKLFEGIKTEVVWNVGALLW